MQTNPFDMTGRVALVTGASSGLGAHFAKILAEAGARVVVAARRADRLEALVAAIRQGGGESAAVTMDVNDADSVTAAFDAAQSTFGTVDVLINNAGVAASKRLINTTETDWEYVVDTNLRAVWRVARTCAERLIAARQPGAIVNIASILSQQPAVGEGLYGAAKAGVVSLTRSLALELQRQRIRVNALCPGYFLTEMNQEYFASEKGQAYLSSIPPRRLGESDELNGPLLLLASGAGSFVNGVALPVDGGHLAQSL